MKAAITDFEFPHVENEKSIFADAGIELEIHQCRTPEDVINNCQDAEALLVQWAPIDDKVLSQLPKCRVIVRYGIGYDNVDVVSATQQGIAVCNIPDYASGEVADHAAALALALARQLPLIDQRLRKGTWNIVPDFPMPCFREMRFVTLGFGRIAQGVHERMRPFGFELCAYDPFVSEEVFQQHAVRSVGLEEALASADILSLHLPMTPQTRHIISRETLRKMKRTAILINTSRGPLIDTHALTQALEEEVIFAAGLDVYESEPVSPSHPILRAPRTILTSHVAWHSSASVSRLQRMVAEEALRGLRGEPLRSRVNAIAA